MRVDRHGMPAGVFDITPFPINENTNDYSVKNDDNPDGKTYWLGTKYYVDGGYAGSDSDGSWQKPWTTVAAALEHVSGHATVIIRGAHDTFNGVYPEYGLRVPSGVDDTHRFMLVGYGQERPVFESSGAMDDTIYGPSNTPTAYVTIQRIKIQNSYREGIYFKPKHSYISVIDVWLYNNDTYDYTNSQIYGDGNLYFLGVDRSWIFHVTSEHTYGHCLKVGDGSTNAIVEWSVARECGYWASFPMNTFYGSHAAGLDFPNGGVGGDDANGDGIPDRNTNLVVRYNISHTVLFEGAQLRRVPNFSFHHNEIFNTMNIQNFTDGASHASAGFPQVDIIEYDTYGNFYSNIIRDPGGSGSANIKVSTYNSNWEAVNIYNNLLYGSDYANFFVYPSALSNNTTIYFYSNSVYGNTPGPLVNVDIVEVPYNLTMRNNILFQSGNGFCIDPCTQRDSSCTRLPEHSNNLYYAPNGTVSRTSLYAIDVATEIVADPGWQSNPSGGYDFAAAALTSDSPARGSGVDLSSLFDTDFAGSSRPRGAAWDVGAYQYRP